MADGTMRAVVERLRLRPASTGELAAATGLTRNGVECALRRAREAGWRIANTHGAGDRRGGFYVIVFDPEDPGRRQCAWPGCVQTLSASNHTRYCRHHLAIVAGIIAIEDMLAADLRGHEDRQLTLVG